jgi:hypothetical protein
MLAWDPGPPSSISALLAQAPSAAYQANPMRFRLAWGPTRLRSMTTALSR